MTRFLLAASAAVAATASTLRSYPLYKQCNSSWGSNEMGINGPGERATICREGCAMSSLSMALAGLGVSIGGKGADPATFNAWLEGHAGYTCIDGDCNNLVLNAVTGLQPSVVLIAEAPKPSVARIQAGLTAGDTIYIAHVHNNSHFVLLTGFNDDESFTVNDPFYDTTAYPYANITDIIMYSVKSRMRRAPAPTRTVNRAGFNGAKLTSEPPSVVRDRVSKPVIPNASPLYKQCDSRWGSHIMQTETICAVGCLMSSTSMSIAGKNITISRQLSTPDTLNTFLQTHSGYVGDNDMDEAAVPQVNPSHISWPKDGMHTTNDIPLAQIQALLKSGRPVIANVMQGKHFVLVTGWDDAAPDTLMVNDPGFDRDTYSYTSDVVGWRLFQMTGCPDKC